MNKIVNNFLPFYVKILIRSLPGAPRKTPLPHPRGLLLKIYTLVYISQSHSTLRSLNLEPRT